MPDPFASPSLANARRGRATADPYQYARRESDRLPAAPRSRRQTPQEIEQEAYEEERKRLEAEANDRQKQETAAAKAALKAQNDAAEAAFRKEGRPFFTNASGQILPTQDDQTYVAEKQRKAANDQKASEYFQLQRPFRYDAQGNVVPRHTDEEWAAQKQVKAAELEAGKIDKANKAFRDQTKRGIDQQQAVLGSNDDAIQRVTQEKQLAADTARAEVAKRKRFIEQAKQRLDEMDPADTQFDTVVAAAEKMQAEMEQYQAQADAADDESRRQQAAKLAFDKDQDVLKGRLRQEDAGVDSLTAPTASAQPATGVLPVGSTPTPRPPAGATPGVRDQVLAGRVAAIAQDSTLDDAARKAALTQLQLRRKDPAAYQTAVKLEMEQAAAETLAPKLEQKIQAHEQRLAELDQRTQAFTQKRDQVMNGVQVAFQRAQQRLAAPHTAGDLVTVPSPDGAKEISLPRDVAEGYLMSLARAKQWQDANQAEADLLEIESDEANLDAQLLNEGVKVLNAKQQAGVERQTAARQQQLADLAASGHETQVRQIQSLDQEAEARLAYIAKMYPENSPERQAAVKAVQQDIGTKQQAVGQAIEAQAQQAAQVYQDWGKGFAGNWLTGETPEVDDESRTGAVMDENVQAVLKAKAKQLGMSEKDLRHHLETQRLMDWSTPSTSASNAQQSGAAHELAKKLDLIGVAEPTRTLPSGDIMPNPELGQSQAKFDEAIQSAIGTQAAKDRAKALWPQYREMWLTSARATLETSETLPGVESYMQWRDNNNAHLGGMTENQKAELYIEKMEQRGGFRKFLDNVSANLMAGSHDILTAIYGSGAVLAGAAERATGAGTFISQLLSEQAAEKSQQAQKLTQAQGIEGISGLVQGIIGQSARMAPGAIATMATGTMTGAMVAGAMQTGGMTYGDAYHSLIEQGYDHADAWAQAAPASTAAGAMTAVLTKAFPGGVTALNNAANRSALQQGIQQALRTFAASATSMGKAAVKGFADEVPQEILDEAFSQFAQGQAEGRAPREVVSEFLTGLPELIGAAGLMGAGGQVLEQVSSAKAPKPTATPPSPAAAVVGPAAGMPQATPAAQPAPVAASAGAVNGAASQAPAQAAAPSTEVSQPERWAAAEAALANFSQTTALPPEVADKTAQKGRVLIKIAQGAKADSLDNDDLHLVGLHRDDAGKITQGYMSKNGWKKGPNPNGSPQPVEMMNGEFVITDRQIERLRNKEVGLGALADAIALPAAERRAQISGKQTNRTNTDETPTPASPDRGAAAAAPPDAGGAGAEAAPAPAPDEAQPRQETAVVDSPEVLAPEEWDRANRHQQSNEWFEGGRANLAVNEAFARAASVGGADLATHGMAKVATLSGAIKALTDLLKNNLDQSRGRDADGARLHTAPLAVEKDSAAVHAGTTSGGTSYRDGPFILVNSAAASRSDVGIRTMDTVQAVLVNEANAGQLDAIRKAIHAIRPDIIVELYSKADQVAAALTGKKQNKQAATADEIPMSWPAAAEGSASLPPATAGPAVHPILAQAGFDAPALERAGLIAAHLQDAGLSADEAAVAAGSVVKRMGVVGDDYTAQMVEDGFGQAMKEAGFQRVPHKPQRWERKPSTVRPAMTAAEVVKSRSATGDNEGNRVQNAPTPKPSFSPLPPVQKRQSKPLIEREDWQQAKARVLGKWQQKIKAKRDAAMGQLSAGAKHPAQVKANEELKAVITRMNQLEELIDTKYAALFDEVVLAEGMAGGGLYAQPIAQDATGRATQVALVIDLERFLEAGAATAAGIERSLHEEMSHRVDLMVSSPAEAVALARAIHAARPGVFNAAWKQYHAVGIEAGTVPAKPPAELSDQQAFEMYFEATRMIHQGAFTTERAELPEVSLLRKIYLYLNRWIKQMRREIGKLPQDLREAWQSRIDIAEIMLGKLEKQAAAADKAALDNYEPPAKAAQKPAPPVEDLDDEIDAAWEAEQKARRKTPAFTPAQQALRGLRQITDPDNDEINVISRIALQGGMAVYSPKVLKARAQEGKAKGGELDWLERADIPPFWKGVIFRRGTKQEVQAMLEQLHREGYFPGVAEAGDVTGEMLAAKIKDVLDRYAALKKGEVSNLDEAEGEHFGKLEAQRVEFERATESGPVKVRPADLQVGDVMQVKGDDGKMHPVKVKGMETRALESDEEFNPEANPGHRLGPDGPEVIESVTLEDGTTFGVQTMDGQEGLYVDEFKVKSGADWYDSLREAILSKKFTDEDALLHFMEHEGMGADAAWGDIVGGIQRKLGLSVKKAQKMLASVFDTSAKAQEWSAAEKAAMMDSPLGSGTKRRASPESARHAELEAKHNAGTITPEETAEAQKLVDAAAKAAGYNKTLYHGGSSGITEFKPPFYVTPYSQYADVFTHGKKGAKKYTVALKQGRETRLWGGLNEITADEYMKAIRSDTGKVSSSMSEALDGHSEKLPAWKWTRFLQQNAPESFKDSGVRVLIQTEKADGSVIQGESYLITDPSQIKSADTFTGVPLSERFNPESNSILSSGAKRSKASSEPSLFGETFDMFAGDSSQRGLLEQAAGTPAMMDSPLGSGTKRRASPESARHAELEAKHNAGTITPEETAEAQRIVDEAAKKAAEDQGVKVFGTSIPLYHGGATPFTEVGWNLKSNQRTFTSRRDTRKTFWLTSNRRGSALFALMAEQKLAGKDPLDAVPINLDDADIEAKAAHLSVRRFFVFAKRIQKLETQTHSIGNRPSGPETLREIQEALKNARDKGYDGIAIHNITDFLFHERAYAVFPTANIKSADPFTGVPLDQRFDQESDSILSSGAKRRASSEPSLFGETFDMFAGDSSQRGLLEQAAGTPAAAAAMVSNDTKSAPAADFTLETITAKQLDAEMEKAARKAKLTEKQAAPLQGSAGEYGTPDMLDITAGPMALFSQPAAQKGTLFAAPKRALMQAEQDAVLPDDAPADIREALRKRGIATLTYATKDKTGRANAVREASTTANALFSGAKRSTKTPVVADLVNDTKRQTKAGRTVGTSKPTAKGERTGSGTDPNHNVDLDRLAEVNPAAYRKNAILLARYPLVAREQPELAAMVRKIDAPVQAQQARRDAAANLLELAKEDIRARLAKESTRALAKAAPRGEKVRPVKSKDIKAKEVDAFVDTNAERLSNRVRNMQALVEKESIALKEAKSEAQRQINILATDIDLPAIEAKRAGAVERLKKARKSPAPNPETISQLQDQIKGLDVKIRNGRSMIPMEKAKSIYDSYIQAVKSNLEMLIQLFPERLRDIARLWYDGANLIAQDFSQKYHATLEQASGVLAVFSPQKDWFMNVSLAERMMRIWKEDQNTVWSQAMSDQYIRRAGEPQQKTKKGPDGAKIEVVDEDGNPVYQGGARPVIDEETGETTWENWDNEKAAGNLERARVFVAEVQGKRLRDLEPEDQARFIRMLSEVRDSSHYPKVTPHGEPGGLMTNEKGEELNIAWGGYNTIEKAIAIMSATRANEAEVISDALGDQHKVRSFYNNIVDPANESGHVTMDTHAVAALQWLPLSGASIEVSQNFGSAGVQNDSNAGLKGMYAANAKAYAEAARDFGLLPREVQSITWEAVRLLFPATWKSQAKNVAAVREVWDRYVRHELTIEAARAEIFQLATVSDAHPKGRDLAGAIADGSGVGDPAWATALGFGPSPSRAVSPADDAGILPSGGGADGRSGRPAAKSGRGDRGGNAPSVVRPDPARRDTRSVLSSGAKRRSFTSNLGDSLKASAEGLRPVPSSKSQVSSSGQPETLNLKPETDLRRFIDAATKGLSTAYAPLERVFMAAKSVNRNLTEREFGQMISAADAAGQVVLEPAESAAAVEKANVFGVRMASGVPAWGVALNPDVGTGRRGDGEKLGSAAKRSKSSLGLTDAISKIESLYTDPSDSDYWPDDVAERYHASPLAKAIDQGDFLAAWDAAPESAKDPAIAADLANLKAAYWAQAQYGDAYDSIWNAPLASVLTPAEIAQAKQSAEPQMEIAKLRNQKVAAITDEFDEATQEASDYNIEAADDWLTSDALEEAAKEPFIQEAKDRAKATIAEIEATGRWEWNSVTDQFDDTGEDNTQVLYSAAKRSATVKEEPFKLDNGQIQAYLELPDVNVPTSKQPAAKRAIRAAGAVSTKPYPQLSGGGGSAGQRDRLADLRERAQRPWRGLKENDPAVVQEAFKSQDSFSTLMHEFTTRQMPSFDIRGAIITSPADFAAFNLAVRSPFFESLKIAILDTSSQVIYSQIVHVGGLSESIADPKTFAGVIATARSMYPKSRLSGWMIAHNHPSGNPSPSDADRRITRRLVEMGEHLGLPLLDHVVTNGEKYVSFRESGLVGGVYPDASIDLRGSKATKPKLPVLPTPPAPDFGRMADWEVMPAGSIRGNSPVTVLPYLRTLRTADPDHYHVLYLDTQHGIRAVERLPVSLSFPQIFQRIAMGAAREGANGFTLGFPGQPVADGQVNESSDAAPTDQQRRLVRRLREQAGSMGLALIDAMTTTPNSFFSFAEHGMAETPAEYGPALGSAAKRSPVDTAAHEAATSPLNDLTPPTKAQQDEGNYKKGHPVIGGHAISIENPAGSKRRPEWPPLKDHYGYFKGTNAKDGDHVDVFVKPGTPEDYAGPVHVVRQVKVENGKATKQFDEYKVMLGYPTAEEARAAYLRNYEPGWPGLERLTTHSAAEFARIKDQVFTVPADRVPGVRKTDQVLASGAKRAQTGGMADPDKAAQNAEPSPGGLSEAESRKILSEARKKRTELESYYTSDAHDVWSESDARENLESELDREPSPEEVADYIAKSQRQHNDEVKELLWEHGTTINHLVWQQIAENALTSLGVKSDGYSNKSEASYWYLPGVTAQNGDALGDAYRIRVASHDPVYTQSDTLVQYDLREILDDNHALEAAIESVNDLKKEITKLNPSFESSRAAGGTLGASPSAEPSPGGLSEAEVKFKRRGIDVVELSLDKITGNDLWDYLVDALDENDASGVGLRGIWKRELGKKKLLNSSNIQSAEYDARDWKHIGKLPGTSVFNLSPDWSYAHEPSFDRAAPFAINAAEKWGDTDYIAIVKGKHLSNAQIDDEGEAVLGNAEVIGYIRRKAKTPTVASEGLLSNQDSSSFQSAPEGDKDVLAPSAPEVNPETSRAAGGTLSASPSAEPSPGGLSEAEVYGPLMHGSRTAGVKVFDPDFNREPPFHNGLKPWFFSETQGVAATYGPHVGEFYLAIKKPLELREIIDRDDEGEYHKEGFMLESEFLKLSNDEQELLNASKDDENVSSRELYKELQGKRLVASSYRDAFKRWSTDHDAIISYDTLDTLGSGGRDNIYIVFTSAAISTNPESSRAAGGTLASAAKRSPVGKVASAVFSQAPVAVASGLAKAGSAVVEKAGLQQVLAKLGSNNLDKFISNVVFGKVAKWAKVESGKQAVEVWLGQPGLLSRLAKGTLDQTVPLWNVPREWLAAYHESQRKAAWGREKAMDVIRALSHNAKVSDMAYPPEFVEDPAWRVKLFDAMEGKADLTTLPQPMQDLAARLRTLLRETGQELVRQGIMSLDTFEELSATGWMPRYTEEEAEAAGGSWLKAFKLGVKDLVAQRSTAWHIVDTTRKEKDGQYAIVSRDEAGKRNRWRFRNEQHRNAFYEDYIKGEAVKLLTAGGKEVTSLLAALDHDTTRAVRDEIKNLTREKIDRPAELSEHLRHVVRRAVELQRLRYKKEAPFEPDKLIKDPVYAIARYVMGATHNAATMELLKVTAKNAEWVSDGALAGFQQMPDNDRFGPLAGKYVRDEIATQVLDLVQVPGTILGAYDAILRTWKAGKLVLNPGSHIRDAVGNIVFGVLAGSNPFNPGNLPFYRDAIAALRDGGDTYAELIEMQVLGGDALTHEVKTALKGLLPDTKTLEGKPVGWIMRQIMGVGATARGAYEWAADVRQIPDNLYKTAAYLKYKAAGMSAGEAAAEVRKWFPYYDRLGTSGLIKQGSRFIMPFSSFFRESTRILGRGAVERPLAMASILSFASGVTALSLMMLGLGDEDEESVFRSMRGKLKLGLSGDRPVFSMLLPSRSGEGQLQQWDLSSVLPFADLLGTRVEMRHGEDEWTKFWRSLFTQSPILSTAWAWSTNSDAFSGRLIVQEDMGALESTKERLRDFGDTMLPPLTPWFGVHANTLANAGRRMSNLETRNTTQSYLRAIVGLDVRSADPNLRTETEHWRQEKNLPLANSGSLYATPLKSRLGRQIKGELIQDAPDVEAVADALLRLEESGNPIKTRDDMEKLLKGLDPDRLIKEEYRRKLIQSFSPEALRVWRTQQSEFNAAQRRLPSVMKAASPLVKARRARVAAP